MQELNSLNELNNGIVFLEVYSTFCNSCKKQVKIIESIENKFSNIKFTKVNTETEAGIQLCQEHNLSQAPTMMVFKQGELVKQFSGLTVPNKLIEILNEVTE